jgi:hypothetical protein
MQGDTCTGGQCGTCPIVVDLLYDTMTLSAQVTEVQFTYQLSNKGTCNLDLAKVTIRYYFLADGAPSLRYSCDYSSLACSNINAQFVTMATPTPMADTYVELSFAGAAGNLPPGSYALIQGRYHDASYSVTFTPANDYSFDPMNVLVDWTHVAVYVSGALIWGTPP